MPRLFSTLCLSLISTLSLSAAPRTWTSTSGSTIEATYLGSFGDELWFEGVGAERKLLKMPAKYISSTDLSLIEGTEISPQIEAKAVDDNEASIALLEQLFKAKTSDPIEGSTTLEEALDRLISKRLQTDETKATFKLHRKVDEDATRAEPINEPTVYACLQALADAHELKWSIRKGILNLRLR